MVILIKINFISMREYIVIYDIPCDYLYCYKISLHSSEGLL